MGWLLKLIFVCHLLLHHVHLLELCGTHALSVTTSVGSLFSATRHLLNLSLVLQMVLVVLVETSLGDDGLFIEQAFCKGMVLSLNSFGFFLADNEIQTGGRVDSCLRSGGALAGLSSVRSGHRRPFAIGNINEFAEENLVLATHDNVLLRLLELSGLFLLSFELFKASFHSASIFRLRNLLNMCSSGHTNLGDLIELCLVDFLSS